MSGRRQKSPKDPNAAAAASSSSSEAGSGPSAAKKRAKREPRAEFSAAVREPALREKVAAAWDGRRRRRQALREEAIILDQVPFHHCIIPNFIQNEEFLEELQKELLNLDFHEKCNDLYKFKQSDDLKNSREPHIGVLRKVLFEEFRAWLSTVTQVELEPTVDLSCAKYEYTDVLLCHDDELEGRRIAFILYLVPPWVEEDGGTLDLFSTDDHFQPLKIIKSLVPSWNSLIFFEVSPVSFHQVSEVVSKEKCRLSVSGWFHGPPVVRPPQPVELPLPQSPHVPHDHEILYEWISPVYLDIDSQAQIQEEFEDRSEILLKDFLKREKFQLVCEALQREGLRWSTRGPPNKRHYQKAEEESLPGILKACMELFRSEALFLLLSNFTGLKLHFLAPEEEEEEERGGGEMPGKDSLKCTPGQSSQGDTSSKDNAEGGSKRTPESGSSTPLCAGELRHWTQGCYTLVHDSQATEFALDLLFFCGCGGWDVEFGGFTSYIAKGEDEELLTVNPEDNCLALVYRDRETLKFVKYINNKSLKRTATQPEETGFWDFCFVYYE